MLVDAFNDTDLSVLREKALAYKGVSQRLEKVASIEVEDRMSLSPEAFAWPEEKLFPIYTPAHAIVSSAYLEGNDDVPEFVKEACENACVLFGLDITIGEMEKTAEHTESLSPEDFLLPEAQKLPVVDKHTLNLSSGVLEKVARELDARDIIVSHRQLVKKAEELGVDVSDEVRALGLYGHIDGRAAKSILHDRYINTGDSGYIKIAEEITGEYVYQHQKVASILIDVANLDAKNRVDEPARDMIVSMVVPGDDMDSILVNGRDIPMEKIASIDPQDWTEIFPDSIVEKMFSSGDIDGSLLGDIIDSSSESEREIVGLFIADKIR
jgi:hypothetical protein